MSPSSTAAFLLAVFGASLVEMVEALTIVVAAGTTRGWRSAMEGAIAALAVLTVLVAAVGIPLVRYVPIDALRVVVGSLLLVLGLSWLRKAILRSSGHLPKHDEDAIYARTTRTLRQTEGAPARRQRDGVGFAVAFKGVFLEGIEVVLIVVSLGASQHRLGAAALAAATAAVFVAAAGFLLARQLSGVPENAIKTVVGIMLTSFGVFWIGEGSGVHWPGGDLAIPMLVGLFAAVTILTTAWMRRLATPSPAPAIGFPNNSDQAVDG